MKPSKEAVVKVRTQGNVALRVEVAEDGKIIGHLEVHPWGVLWIPKHGKRAASHRVREGGILWYQLADMEERLERKRVNESANIKRSRQ